MKKFEKLKQAASIKVELWKLLTAFLILAVAVTYGFYRGLGGQPETVAASRNETYANIKKLEKVNELVLLNARIEKVKVITNDTKIFGQKIIASEKKAIITLNYNAKFGIKENVNITQKAAHQYEVAIPKYQTIGFQLDKKNPYTLTHKSTELLSGLTGDTDTGEAVVASLSDKEQQEYLDSLKDEIAQSVQNYYTGLIKSIDPEGELLFKNVNQ